MTRERLRTAGIGISSVSATAAAVFWLGTYAGATPWSAMPGGTVLALAGLGALAALAAFHSWLAVCVLFLVRFVPYGFYLLGAPSWIALIGVLDLAYLTGGIVMHVAEHEAPS